jgi:ketosteroid isomerase-like protein
VLRENEETARRVHDAFNRTFAEDAPDLYELVDPEVEWMPLTTALEGTRYRGTEGIAQWIDELRRDWDVFEIRAEEYRDLGDDRMLVLGTWRVRGRGSGVELDTQQAYWLLSLRAGKIIRLETFTDSDRAFAAAGPR